jgi:hypothetical protein
VIAVTKREDKMSKPTLFIKRDIQLWITPPFSGNTTAVQNFPDRFVDWDVVVSEILDVPQFMLDAIYIDELTSAKIRVLAQQHANKGRILLSNHPFLVRRITPTKVFKYSASEFFDILQHESLPDESVEQLWRRFNTFSQRTTQYSSADWGISLFVSHLDDKINATKIAI